MKGVTKRKVNGSVYWYATVDGKRVACGKSDQGREVAEYQRREWEQKQLRRKLGFVDEEPEEPEVQTIAELVDWYMGLSSVQEKKSFCRKISGVKHLLDFFGDKPLKGARPDEQEKYRQWRRDQGAGDGTIDYELACLCTIFRKAELRDKIRPGERPKEFVLKRDVNPRRTITDKEYARLLDAASGDFRDILIIGYETGMRSGEICGLLRKQVTLDEVRIVKGEKRIVSAITLSVKDTKTKMPRVVPLSEEVKAVLNARIKGLKGESRVFPAWSNVRVAEYFKRACKNARVPHGDKLMDSKGGRRGVTFHCLRHTRITKWEDEGMHPLHIMMATGHTDVKMHLHYSHPDTSGVMSLVAPKSVQNRVKTSESLA